MWSFPSTSQSEAMTSSPLPDYPHSNFHPFVNAAKDLIEKIKTLTRFRRVPSDYVPYEAWRSMYMNNELSNMASSGGGGSKYTTVLYDYEFVGIRRRLPPDNYLALYSSSHSTSTDFDFQGSENGASRDGHFSAGSQKERGEGGNLEVSNGVPERVGVTNCNNARDAITCARLQEPQIESGEDPVNTELNHRRENREVSHSMADLDAQGLERDNHVTEDGRPLPLMSAQGKLVPTNESNPNLDFQKDRIPGSTIETKTNGNTGDPKKGSRGEDRSRESQFEEGFQYVEEELYFSTTSSDSARRDSSARGFLGRSWNHKRRRVPLSRVSFRGMLYRTYHKVRRVIETRGR